MTDALDERDELLGGFVDGPALEDYAAKCADHFVIERNEGVAEVRMHTGDRAAVFSRGLLNAWGQLLRDLGADRENEVLILTGTGRQWIAGFDPMSFAQARPAPREEEAIVAVGRSILVIVWYLLRDDATHFNDLGPGYYDSRVNPERKKRNHIRKLEALGYRVTLQPAA